MLIVGCFADIYDIYDRISHFSFIGHGISSRQLFLDQIKGKQQFVFQQEGIVLFFITTLAFYVLCFEKETALMNNSFGCSILVFLLKRGASEETRARFFFLSKDACDNMTVDCRFSNNKVYMLSAAAFPIRVRRKEVNPAALCRIREIKKWTADALIFHTAICAGAPQIA